MESISDYWKKATVFGRAELTTYEENWKRKLRLTQAQRKVVAEIAPELADWLKLDKRNQRTIPLTLAELKTIKVKAGGAIRQANTGMVRNSLRHVTDLAAQALGRSRGLSAIPAAERVYQFEITLLDTQPPIWRRIQVQDCTLDKLHEHIQTAMGWTNSHLHHFRIGEQLYGDPLLMTENFEDMGYEDSTTTELSDLIPEGRRRFRFLYEYDFGDSWQHEVLFEKQVEAEAGQKYPLCADGARACPPEDVGGTWGRPSRLPPSPSVASAPGSLSRMLWSSSSTRSSPTKERVRRSCGASRPVFNRSGGKVLGATSVTIQVQDWTLISWRATVLMGNALCWAGRCGESEDCVHPGRPRPKSRSITDPEPLFKQRRPQKRKEL